MKQKDLKNTSRSKYSYTITGKLLSRKTGFMTSVPNSLFLGQNSFWPDVTAKDMLAVHLLETKLLSCSYRHAFTDRTIYEHVCLFVCNIPTSDSSKQKSNVSEILVSHVRKRLICDLSDFCTVYYCWCSKIFQ
jgi:hypothetical protein